jgi:hypothetical protein
VEYTTISVAECPLFIAQLRQATCPHALLMAHSEDARPAGKPSSPTNQLHGAVLLETLTVAHIVRHSLPFMQPKDTLTCSQASTT